MTAAPEPFVIAVPEAVLNDLQRLGADMTAGGHCAALEEPQALVQDIRAFYRALR